MLKFLYAGIIVARHQLAALAVLTLILLLVTPNSLTPGAPEILPLSATPIFAWGYVLVALGVALTSSRSIDVTASRLQRASRSLRRGSPQYILMTLVAQFGLAAILFAVFALQAPPNAVILVGQYFGFPSAISIMWTAAMSVGVAGFGASAHSAVKAVGAEH